MIAEKYYRTDPILTGKVMVYSNEVPWSLEIRHVLEEKLVAHGFCPVHELTPDVVLIMVIGGDGTLLSSLHYMSFPETPIVGINTGHLGFFQDLSPDQLDEFLERIKLGKYSIQPMRTVKAQVDCAAGEFTHTGLNEVLIKSRESRIVHLDLFIGDSFIERFSGDGILAASPAGSTAYNYALGGSICDPRLELMQLTPMAPMSTAAFRSFTSSVLLPAGLSVVVRPEEGSKLVLAMDGLERIHEDIRQIRMEFAPQIVRLVRLDGYDFWNTVKRKLL